MAINNRCNGGAVYLPPLESCDECDALSDQVTALDNSVDAMQTALSSTNSNVAALQTAVTSLTRRIADLETLIGNKQNTVLSMTDENNNVTTVTVLAE